jgi:acyl carrier protein
VTIGQGDSLGALSHGDALDWIAELFEEPKGRIQPTTPRGDVAAWDSLGQLVLMSALDQRFGIRLTQDELASLRSIQDILEILGTHGRLARG